MNKLQQAISSLLFAEPFYGHLISKMRISKSDKVPSAGVSITDKINLFYNEAWIESLDLIDVVKVLKHECGHILQEHIIRAKQIGIVNSELHKRFNLATDATINTHDLVPTVEKIGGVTVDSLNEKLKQMIDEANAKDKGNRKFSPMKEGEIAEYYYNKINEFAEENSDILPQGSGFGDTMDDHSTWEESDGNEEMQKEVAKQAVNDSVKSCGGIGNVPGEIASLVAELNKSQVNWKQQLRQFYVNTLKSTKLATRKRRNRRYGILQPGVKKKPELHLGLCVDTSGSVSDEELTLFWEEMKAIYSCGVKITVIEADCVVQNVYEFEGKKTPEFRGRGGTSYNPAIKKALELKVDGILYCGDFDTADTPENPKKPFLWVGVRKSPPPADFGKVIYLGDLT
jgi:predicted metal-dependent peptidase